MKGTTTHHRQSSNNCEDSEDSSILSSEEEDNVRNVLLNNRTPRRQEAGSDKTPRQQETGSVESTEEAKVVESVDQTTKCLRKSICLLSNEIVNKEEPCRACVSEITTRDLLLHYIHYR